MASKKPEKKSAPTKPITSKASGAPPTVKARVPPLSATAKAPTSTGKIHVEENVSITDTLKADYYQISLKHDALVKLRQSSDGPARQETIARKMRLIPGIEVPHKGDFGYAFDQDFETLWRHIEGLDMKGSRGPTIEDLADKKSA
jgi:hypothetical protein